MDDEQTLSLIRLITLKPLSVLTALTSLRSSAGRTVSSPHCDHETPSGSQIDLFGV